MTKLVKMKKNDVIVGLPVKSLFSGSFGKVVMSPNANTNNILIKWDNGSDSYGDFTKFKNIVAVTNEEYEKNYKENLFIEEMYGDQILESLDSEKISNEESNEILGFDVKEIMNTKKM